MNNHYIKTSFVSPYLQHLGVNKTALNCTYLYPQKAVYNTMHNYSGIAWNPINIRWIITGSHKELTSFCFFDG